MFTRYLWCGILFVGHFFCLGLANAAGLSKNYSSLGSIDLYSSQFANSLDTPVSVGIVSGEDSDSYLIQSEISNSGADEFASRIRGLRGQLREISIYSKASQFKLVDWNSLEGELAYLDSAAPLNFYTRVTIPFTPVNYVWRDNFFRLFMDVSINAQSDFLSSDVELGSVKAFRGIDASVRDLSITNSRAGIDYMAPEMKFGDTSVRAGIRATYNYLLYHDKLSPLIRQIGNKDAMVADEGVTSSAMDYAVGLGFRFERDSYVILLTVDNLNEPEFVFDTAVSACYMSIQPQCKAARSLKASGRVGMKDKFVMSMQGSVQATFKSEEFGVRLSGFMNTNPVVDLFGFESQLARMEVSFETDSPYFSGFFVSFEKNLVGQKSNKYILGASFAKYVRFIGYGTTEVVDSWGINLPRDLGVSLRFVVPL